ncbi:MAG: ABC transporter ATP-binding protein, partial [Clostridia bacterium]|nr:ABC transporter ATP-binding protein [Clostridia bacterium]
MHEYYPLIVVGLTLILSSVLFAAAYLLYKRTKAPGDENERKMSDGEVIRRLLRYAKPYRFHFLLVLAVMLLSTCYSIFSPILVGQIEELVKNSFDLPELYRLLAVYASLLIVSLICMYVQAIVLQKTGQKIISRIRLDTFSHIESLSHIQLNSIPVGKLVTRVSNDPNHISYLFTNILVNLLKNALVIVGVLTAMFLLNLELSLMVLCFVP